MNKKIADFNEEKQENNFFISYLSNREKTVQSDIFSYKRPFLNEKKIISLVIRWQLAKRRSGNHAVKSRSEVSHSTRKLFSQKGRGAARVGDSASPMRRGGGVAMGPVKRDHSYYLNNKIVKLSVLLSMLQKIRHNLVFLAQESEVEKISKTKDFSHWFGQYSENNQKFLFVCTYDFYKNYSFLVKNITNVNFIALTGLNTYDIVRHEKVIFLENAYSQWIDNFKGVQND